MREEGHFWSPSPEAAFSAAHSEPGGVSPLSLNVSALLAEEASTPFPINLHGHDGPANTIECRPFRAESFQSLFQEFVMFLI